MTRHLLARRSRTSRLRSFELLEDRRLLAGKGVAFFVNGFTGEAVPEDVLTHLKSILVAKSWLDWHNDGNSDPDIYETNWNSPDPRSESGDPGGLVAGDLGDIFELSTVDILGVDVPVGVNIAPIDDPAPGLPNQFITNLAQILDTEYDDDDFIVLIGHSLGGNSVLRVANETDVQIDLLATLDPVGWSLTPDASNLFGFEIIPELCADNPFPFGADEFCVPGTPVDFGVDISALTVAFQDQDFIDPQRGVPGYRNELPSPSANVKYFYNRWQQTNFFPFDFRKSGMLDAGEVQENVEAFSFHGRAIQEQEQRNEMRDEDLDEIFRDPGALDILFQFAVPSIDIEVDFGEIDDPKLPPDFSLAVDFGSTSRLLHGDVPSDPYIQAELKSLLDTLVPQPPTAHAGSDLVVDEGALVTLDASGSFDPNPGETATLGYEWDRIAGPANAGVPAKMFGKMPAFTSGDNGVFEFRLTVTDVTGESDTDVVTVTVHNVAPVVTSLESIDVGVRGFPVDFSVGFTDPGFLDSHDVAWDFGDGRGIGFAIFPVGARSTTASHTFTHSGTYTVAVSITDDDSDSGAGAKDIEIKAAGLIPDPDDPSKLALAVGGTLGDDSITLLPGAAPGEIEVIVNGASEGIFTPTGQILVAGQDGDDTITISAAITRNSKIDGGSGDDTIRGGSGADAISGGDGDDWIDGGDGNDTLRGNNGNDRFALGPGADVYDGGPGVDAIHILGLTGQDTIFVDQTSTTGLANQINGIQDSDSIAALEVVQIEGGPGDDVIGVRVQHALGAAGGSLEFRVFGDGPNASDRLVVFDDGIGDLVLHRQGPDHRSGSVTVGQLAPVVYEGIENVDVSPLNPVSDGTGSDGLGRLVVFAADPFEQNDSRRAFTDFAALAEATVRPTIDPAGATDPFGIGVNLPGDEDWYRWVAPKTGTFRFNLDFEVIGTLPNGQPGLPGAGKLQLGLYNVNAAAITKNVGDGDAAQTVGVQQGQVLFVRVRGVTGVEVNRYAVDLAEVDVLGPRVTDLRITGNSTFNLFDAKTDGTHRPTPLVTSLTISLDDPLTRAPGFLYPALNAAVAGDPGHFRLVGDASGVIPISSVSVTNGPVSVGAVPTATIKLTFASPLPDDRYTLTVFDAVADPADNALDGESNAIEPHAAPNLPSGDGVAGGDFVARFTVDSRAELGVWAGGSVYVDTNGNFVNDPEGKDGDHTNEDIAYVLGYTSDNIVAGNFAGAGPDGVLGTSDDRAAAAGNAFADGFDKLAAYGLVAGAWRWLVDTDNNGVPNLVVTDPSAVNGLPVAGNFDGIAANGDEVALKSGSTWYFDRNHDYRVDGGMTSNLMGLPIVGDFDGDGVDDLGAWVDDTFSLDLSSELTGAPLAGSYDPEINGTADRSFRFGFVGVRERPVAADFDGDGIDDIGLWVPDRVGASSDKVAEWYILVSAGRPITARIVPNPQGAGFVVDFTPEPFAHDLFGRFGNEFALPVPGNFDPPVVGDAPPEYSVLSFTNPQNRLDVDGNGLLSALDALVLINLLNRDGSQVFSTIPLRFEAAGTAPFVDPTADYALTPADVVAVVNGINAAMPAGEGESVVPGDILRVDLGLTPSLLVPQYFPEGGDDSRSVLAGGMTIVQPPSSSVAHEPEGLLAVSANQTVAANAGQGLPVAGDHAVASRRDDRSAAIRLDALESSEVDEILETLARDVASIWR